MRYRVGVMEYLLGRPLVYGLQSLPEPVIDVQTDVPSRIGDRVLAGDLDAGLMPAVQILENDGLWVLPGPCVACDGPVESIRLYHKVPLERVERVALDTSSRTSVLLAQVILRDAYGCAPEAVRAHPDRDAMLEAADAALLIGDPALRAGDDVPYEDLGAAWHRLTGMPFVFAMWGMRSPDPALAELLRAAWRDGKRAVARIAEERAAEHGLDAAQMTRYLARSIRYDLTPEALRGLREFATRAEAHGLLRRDGRWLRFAD
ncbi:MAG TPA: menaquinone biosynthesis protein [Armatimonadota bacterium]|nr:menaquinone biosynthesis protein [Armatimonadota bacterium]